MSVLKQTLDWIDTMAERRGLTDDQRGEASVLARRRIENKGVDGLPKTIARNAVEDVRGDT